MGSKIALVTGGSRGIGRAIAERLGRDGFTVAITYSHDKDAAEEVVMRIGPGHAFAIQATFGVHGDATALWQAFDAHPLTSGAVDIIVNNAGITRSSDLASLTEAEFDQIFAVNVRAPFFVVQEGLRRLRDGGRIINISAGTARLALPDLIAYGPTKAALDNFTLNLAKALGERGITANSVAPGIVDTYGWFRDNPEAEAHAVSLAALGRLGQPEDIADIVGFLASDDARWMTGRVIDATGGVGL
ncbi:NAD(P)-dependent dehydrogenase (short-subunit alcohol dehydrogenase family) [Nonomuraea thailandensis]|uniref:NAD(P)-dependent dehydrogenase (Short-subunit alcohol dehydrogenase family) n=1 Tax=Nonomuraea thailandensis TaxID=1188745 RepID=A0A9X2GD37_9ACTN|nr:SDR family oxidoreductase [Nonomuraea thailandensis]MCP2356706.1 NAD(P)-dependent dehydrogenase (short-subunit alcohol dehydrogenase family) [Nonomuraea thailandensis]